MDCFTGLVFAGPGQGLTFGYAEIYEILAQ